MKIVFDNLVDVKTGKPVQAEVSDERVAGERPLSLFPPHLSTEEIGERARAAGQRFRAMFMRE